MWADSGLTVEAVRDRLLPEGAAPLLGLDLGRGKQELCAVLGPPQVDDGAALLRWSAYLPGSRDYEDIEIELDRRGRSRSIRYWLHSTHEGLLERCWEQARLAYQARYPVVRSPFGDDQYQIAPRIRLSGSVGRGEECTVLGLTLRKR